MRKFLFVFIFLLAAKFVFAQDESDTVGDSTARGNPIWTISAGQFQADFSGFNSQLKTWGATKTFLPFNTIGINLVGGVNVSRGGNFDAALCFEKILPQQISIGDSLKYNLYGWHFMSSIYGFFIGKPHFVATAGPGIDWGSVKIKGNLNGNETHYKNPFVSPFIRAEFRFVFGRIVFGARASYRYDISKKNWEQDNSTLSTLPNSKISGLGLQFFLGARFGYIEK